MMQIKFQGYRPFGAREEDFLRLRFLFYHIWPYRPSWS